jgi:bifunctional UDP-N-acetylglucosamine pyrophosphorylase/glucosamine-1-phosphate N-acetyltransferase
MKAVVLAAGEGIRLRPLTNNRPKHLLPIGGKPLLEHLLLGLKKNEITEALIVVHYKAEQLKQFFGDGAKLGMKLEYMHQSEIKGTADAIALAESHVEEDFLVVYGDLFITPNAIKNVLETYQKEKKATIMAVVTVKHPEHYGIIRLEGSQVTEIIEKPSREKAPTNLANAGIYIFSKEIFEKIKQTTPSQRGELEITDSLSLLLKEKKPIWAVQLKNTEWKDVGKPWDLLEANQLALSQMEPKIEGQIENNVHFTGAVRVAKGARIRCGTYIEGPAFIDQDSDIGPNCYIRPFTSIGKNVRIGNACEIKNSIVMDKTHIGHLSYVGDSIIGEGCNFGAGTIIANFRFDGKSVKMRVKDEIVDTERTKMGAVFGDNVKTGINSLFMPGVKVGSNSWIGPNVVISRDVPSNTMVLLKQQLEERELR